MTDSIIKQAREYMGYSREDIAGVLGITADDLGDLERGCRRPTAAELDKLSRLYRRDPVELSRPGPDEVSWGPRPTSLEHLAKGLPIEDRTELAMFARMLRFKKSEVTR